MPDVKQIISRIEELQQEEAVWLRLLDLLTEYVDHDASNAGRTLPVPDCARGAVSQDVFIKISGQISDGPLKEVLDHLGKLRGVEVPL